MNRPPPTGYRRTVRFQNAQRAWKTVRANFKPFEDKKYLKYEKVLGYGGYGLVQAWSVCGPNGVRERGIAIKALTRPGSKSSVKSLRREIYWHKRFEGASHLIQLVDLDDKVMKRLDINNEKGTGAPVLIMEEMGGGSAWGLMERLRLVRRANPRVPLNLRCMEYIPNRCLWSIFLCLIRSCIGMNFVADTPLEERQDARINESLGAYGRSHQANRIVHNDIDIQNIFIAAPVSDDKEHALAPLCKIADYGCMVEWDDDWDQETKKKSVVGKRSYMAPEQWHRKLTYLRGSLGCHTNIYQIGCAMHDLITLTPVSANTRNYKRRQKNSTVTGVEYDTYGWRLLEHDNYVIDAEYRKVDLQLRELVAACMAYQANERPDLAFLETLATHHIERLAKQASEAAQQGLYDLGNSYRIRVPMGEVEPNVLIEGFVDGYFNDAWGNNDPHKDFWEGRILTATSATQASGSKPSR